MTRATITSIRRICCFWPYRTSISQESQTKITPNIGQKLAIRLTASLMLQIVAAPILTILPSVAETVHGISMHGVPELGPNFTHLPYVNPRAPKGGRITLGVFGSYNSLNPLIIRGVAPPAIRGLVYESLMTRNGNEPFSLYGLIAEKLEVPDDRSWVIFHINPSAQFSDGKPVTSADVEFSFKILARQGRPYMRSHYAKVAKVEILSAHKIRFTFKELKANNTIAKSKGRDREIPLIMALMPVLPKHAINPATFNSPSLKPPIGSGPYRVTQVAPGAALTYQRNLKYWGRNLPIRRGLYNADQIHMRYYRDGTALFEALKSGAIDLRRENDPGRWVAGYDFPAIADKRIRKYEFDIKLPAGMTGLVFNTRRPQFKDPNIRRALMIAFDARRINKQLFHDRYRRSQSYFSRSTLSTTAKPATKKERALLALFPKAVKPEIMAGTWRVPGNDTTQAHRKNLRRAFELFKRAGYRLNAGRLVETATAKPFKIQFLVLSRQQARIAVVFAESLKRLGITAKIRQVDDTQYWSRIGIFDFDIIQWSYSASLSPGNEQINRWSSSYADIERSLNYAGVKNPAVDAMIDHMLTAKDRTDFEAAVRAFDRVLLSGDYLVPLFHLPKLWIAASTRLGFPKTTPLFGTSIHMWWVKPKR